MLNFDRTRASSVGRDTAGAEYTLVSERLSVTLGGSWGGLGVSYTHPQAIVRAGEVSPIFDLVLIARLGALLLVTLAAIVGTVRR